LPPAARSPQAVNCTLRATQEFPPFRVAAAFADWPLQSTFSGSAGMPFSRPGLNIPRQRALPRSRMASFFRGHRACAARSVLEGGGARCQSRDSRGPACLVHDVGPGPRCQGAGYPRCFLKTIIKKEFRSRLETAFRRRPRTPPGLPAIAASPQNPSAPDKPAPNATAADCRPFR
jgi:hypothetical protein